MDLIEKNEPLFLALGKRTEPLAWPPLGSRSSLACWLLSCICSFPPVPARPGLTLGVSPLQHGRDHSVAASPSQLAHWLKLRVDPEGWSDSPAWIWISPPLHHYAAEWRVRAGEELCIFLGCAQQRRLNGT